MRKSGVGAHDCQSPCFRSTAPPALKIPDSTVSPDSVNEEEVHKKTKRKQKLNLDQEISKWTPI